MPLIGTYVRVQMAESHVTLRCMGIEQGLSLPAYDVLIPHRVSMKRNHHDELQWSIVMRHMMTAAPEQVEWQPNFQRRGLVSIPGCPWCSILTKCQLIRFFSETLIISCDCHSTTASYPQFFRPLPTLRNVSNR